MITWVPPAAPSSAGTALSTAQLSATANVPGVFLYTPAAGTVLPVGAAQTLSVLFTPTDAAGLRDCASPGRDFRNHPAAPVAQNGAVTTDEDTPVHGTLSASDPEGDALTFSLVTLPQPTGGTVVIDNPSTGAFTYTPPPNRSGGDSFTFQASDGHETSNVASDDFLTIRPVNDGARSTCSTARSRSWKIPRRPVSSARRM